MKFFSLLAFVAAVSATPVPGLELSIEQPKDLAIRQSNLAQVVATTVQTANTAITSSLNSISTSSPEQRATIRHMSLDHIYQTSTP